MTGITTLQPGTVAYRRANVALFLGGWATFALLYGPQPLLPLFAIEFEVSAASASLLVSMATATLALTLIPASLLADRYGRSRMMKGSLVLAALCALLLPLANTFPQLVILRGLAGVATAGLPAAAMAWLGDEMSPGARGRAMGLYIAGNALGGMSGRFLTALVTDLASWQLAFLVLGLLGSVVALAFWRLLPPARHFEARSLRPRALLQDLWQLLRDPGLPWLFLVAFLLMGVFVAFYNYLGFRLSLAPFELGQTAIGAVFLLYVLGTWSSAASGRLADQYGPWRVALAMTGLMIVGLLLSLPAKLPVLITGVALLTFGFFGVHAIASGWVGARAQSRRALASALYLTSYYLGGSIPPLLGGVAWDRGQWPALVALLTVLLLCLLGVVSRLRHR
jgi:MFS transporter, YNFM family, putative membrane transport protein